MARQARHVKEAKRRRARVRSAARASRRRVWQYISIVFVAAGVIGAFFLISAGGNSTTDIQSSYPPNYSPPTQGDPNAPVEVVMYGDFQCPSCRSFEANTLPQLRELYVNQGKVRLVWRNFEHYGAESVAAATAAHCAGEQGKFWEYHDILYRNQRGIGSGAFSDANLKSFAEQLGLRDGAFTSCLTGVKYEKVLAGDFKMARNDGVNGTPGFFVNGLYVAGAQPFNTFKAIIDSELAKVQ